MKSPHLKVLAARTGAAALLSLGLIAGLAGAPAGATTLTQSKAPTTTLSYTVLGDSYSAGSGGAGEVGACAQSPYGYGNDVAAATGATLTNLACAGFTTDQVTALEVPLMPANTRFVTLTVGGNDVGWTTAVAACLENSSTSPACRSAVANALYQMTQLPKRISTLVKAIKAKAPGARVVFLGYPRLFEPPNMAAAGFTTDQINGAKTVNGATDLLNADIALSALSNRAGFVSVAGRFAGHGFPSADPWLNGPYGPSPYAFHPTATGYQLGYAAAVEAYL